MGLAACVLFTTSVSGPPYVILIVGLSLITQCLQETVFIVTEVCSDVACSRPHTSIGIPLDKDPGLSPIRGDHRQHTRYSAVSNVSHEQHTADSA